MPWVGILVWGVTGPVDQIGPGVCIGTGAGWRVPKAAVPVWSEPLKYDSSSIEWLAAGAGGTVEAR